MRPSSLATRATMAATAALSVTSATTDIALTPRARKSAAAASDFASLRPTTATSAPASASPRAMPRPMPPLPPVTMATLPARSKSLVAIFDVLVASSNACRARSGRARPSARAAPYQAQWIWLIMKLDAGHWITPVPWPIQSSPIASARMPVAKSRFRMGCSRCWLGAEQRRRATAVTVAFLTGFGKAAGRRRTQCRRHGSAQASRKKAPAHAGAFELFRLGRESVLRDDRRTTPVEAVDQLAADGVGVLLRSHRKNQPAIPSR